MRFLPPARRAIVLPIMGLCILMAACQPVRPVTPASTPRSPNGVILTAEQTQAQLDWISNAAEGAWTPSDAEVAQLETDLLPFLRQAQNPWLRPDPPIWERAPEYKRQYLGVIEGGERVIYANFFCRIDEGIEWAREFVLVMDGGDCYFQVTYHPQSGEFSDFSVNGEG